MSELSLSNKEKIWLHHHRLGHPSFRVIQVLFPSLFKSLDVENFHCDVCELAKHKLVSFPISNKRSLFPFYLVHSEIWGPSTIPNVSRARWFVSFIDDCTRVTCVSTPQQNGVAERENGHLLESTQALLFQKRCPSPFGGKRSLPLLI